jgi:hypothetical protein
LGDKDFLRNWGKDYLFPDVRKSDLISGDKKMIKE